MYERFSGGCVHAFFSGLSCVGERWKRRDGSVTVVGRGGQTEVGVGAVGQERWGRTAPTPVYRPGYTLSQRSHKFSTLLLTFSSFLFSSLSSYFLASLADAFSERKSSTNYYVREEELGYENRSRFSRSMKRIWRKYFRWNGNVWIKITTRWTRSTFTANLLRIFQGCFAHRSFRFFLFNVTIDALETSL